MDLFHIFTASCSHARRDRSVDFANNPGEEFTIDALSARVPGGDSLWLHEARLDDLSGVFDYFGFEYAKHSLGIFQLEEFGSSQCVLTGAVLNMSFIVLRVDAVGHIS